MYNTGPELSFVGPFLDQNYLQRLAAGKELTVVVLFYLFVSICVFEFVCVLCLLIAVLLVGW